MVDEDVTYASRCFGPRLDRAQWQLPSAHIVLARPLIASMTMPPLSQLYSPAVGRAIWYFSSSDHDLPRMLAWPVSGQFLSMNVTMAW